MVNKCVYLYQYKTDLLIRLLKEHYTCRFMCFYTYFYKPVTTALSTEWRVTKFTPRR